MPKVSKSSKLRHMKTGTTVRRELEVHSTWWNAVLTLPSSALGHFGTLGGLSRGGWPGSVDDCGYCILNKSTHKYKTTQVFLQKRFCKIFIQCILFFFFTQLTHEGSKVMSVHLSKTCLMRLNARKLLADSWPCWWRWWRWGDPIVQNKEGGKIGQLAARLLVCLSAAAQCVPYSSVLQSFVRWLLDSAADCKQRKKGITFCWRTNPPTIVLYY